MRLPASFLEHPVESAIAGLLLMALLFVSAGTAPAPGQADIQSSAKTLLPEKM